MVLRHGIWSWWEDGPYVVFFASKKGPEFFVSTEISTPNVDGFSCASVSGSIFHDSWLAAQQAPKVAPDIVRKRIVACLNFTA